jgi:two-component system, NtrC family, sensor kinase
VRLGIRAQLVLSLAALLGLAFAPLFFAIANLARATFAKSWADDAHGLGRAIAAHVSEARAHRSGAELGALLDAQLGGDVIAVGLYDREGTLAGKSGEGGATLPSHVEPGREDVGERDTAVGPALMVVVPSQQGAVAVLLHAGGASARAAPLVRLVALYVGLLGLGLLFVAYLVLTRLVVNPIDQLSRAASRVADGARQLRAPAGGGREIAELGASLTAMTASLRGEEERMRDKVAELARAHHELERAQETVIKSERLASVGRLAAGLAHEIGNPIAAILSFEELLLDGPLEEDQREFVVRMKHETERVHRILRSLLDFARPAASTPDDAGETPASVKDAVDQVVGLVRPQKALHDVELVVELAPGLPAVAMRAERIEQVLLNLVLNAADAVPRPGGRVRIEAVKKKERVRLSVEDNGGGIAPSVRGKLFEPFVTTKEVGKGTGLGLAVCRGLVEAAGGAIVAEEGEEGARFVVELPIARD